MLNKETWCVKPISREEALPLIVTKHYAHRIPSISFAFGLFNQTEMRGVVTFGTPASSTLLKGVCGPEWASCVVELNRLVLVDDTPPNAESFLIGRAIHQLPPPKIIVSYADTAAGHVGYVYQACNFLYTGLSARFTDPKVHGLEHLHHATYAHGKTNAQLRAEYGDRLYFVARARKHRYVYFHRCSTARAALRYAVQPYPKGDTTKH